MAKATLWKMPPLRPFLAAFQAIPVTRPKDGQATAESIEQCFRKVHQVLEQGGSVALFPEGISHSGGDLAPLKTGAARIALSGSKPIHLVPAGLVYGDRASFRHSVLLRVGPPIAWDDLASRGIDPDAVLELTARIRRALLPLTLHDEDARRLGLAQHLAWLLAEAPGTRVDLEALRQRVQDLLPHLATMAPEAIADLESRVQAAQSWLQKKGLRPDQVGYPYPGSEIRRWLPWALCRFGVAVVVVPASLLFLPPYGLVAWIARHFTEEGDQRATLKLLGGLLLHPLWAFGLAGLMGWRWGRGRGAAMIPLVALGVAAWGLPLLDRCAEDLQAIRGFLRRRDPAVPGLLAARRELLEAFPELVG
jgi:hypothetical protein